MASDLIGIMFDICEGAEWAGWDAADGSIQCPICSEYQQNGHKSDCLFVQYRAALKKMTKESLVSKLSGPAIAPFKVNGQG